MERNLPLNTSAITPSKTKVILLSFLIIFFIISVFAYSLRYPILHKIGTHLVHKDPLEKAEAIVVLSGSFSGERILMGSKLFHAQFADFILISGVETYPGQYDFQNIKNRGVKMGIPEEKITTQLIEGEKSTWGEALLNLEYLEKSGITSFIIVTSDYHTLRAYKIYDSLIHRSKKWNGMKFSIQPIADPKVPLDQWWDHRLSKKVVFLEYLKLIDFEFRANPIFNWNR